METNTLIILIVVAVLVILIVAALAIVPRVRTRQLRNKFGTEYDYVVDQVGDQRKAEAELAEREKRVDSLEIRALSPEDRRHYIEEWNRAQAEFVDEPSRAVRGANQLIKEVMQRRGFPVADFEQRTADVSVIYPNVVSNYRAAHQIAEKNEQDRASTEELRQAMVYYRSLFEELLETEESEPKENTR